MGAVDKNLAAKKKFCKDRLTHLTPPRKVCQRMTARFESLKVSES